jgi:hypothetical protein
MKRITTNVKIYFGLKTILNRAIIAFNEPVSQKKNNSHINAFDGRMRAASEPAKDNNRNHPKVIFLKKVVSANKKREKRKNE